MDKVDFKKTEKMLYAPRTEPSLVDVPAMVFIAVDGKGPPEGDAYQAALQALYALTFTIKMSKKGGDAPEGYFDYVVPPLEGLWYQEGAAFDFNAPRDSWQWTSMIRQPTFVTHDVFIWARETCAAKKPEVDISRARLMEYHEGLCVQALHVGPYSAEGPTLGRMASFIQGEGLQEDHSRAHHEVYLSDPRRTAPERWKTILRTPVQ